MVKYIRRYKKTADGVGGKIVALIKETDYGKITISDKVIESYVADCCQVQALYDKVWLAAKPSILAEYTEDEKMQIGFSVYVKFGQSIRAICKILADMVAEQIYKRSGTHPSIITINVAGVKSNNLVKRNMDVVFEYD